MFIPFLAAISLAPQNGLHQTQRCGPVVVEGVSWIKGSPYLQAWIRTRGQLPAGGVWSLKMQGFTHPDGSALRSKGPLSFGRTDDANSIGGVQLSEDSPNGVRVRGELVHYQTVQEAAIFPNVRLEIQRGWVSHSTTIQGHTYGERLWEVPPSSLVTTKTPSVLALAYFSLPMAGYSGPLYDDLARFPIRVMPETLSAGLSAQRRQFHSRAEERIDASVGPYQTETIYQKDPPINGAVFSFRDKDFKRTVSLTARVTRMLPDKRYPFTLVLPVQKGRDPFEKSKAVPDRTKMVVWPK